MLFHAAGIILAIIFPVIFATVRLFFTSYAMSWWVCSLFLFFYSPWNFKWEKFHQLWAWGLHNCWSWSFSVVSFYSTEIWTSIGWWCYNDELPWDTMNVFCYSEVTRGWCYNCWSWFSLTCKILMQVCTSIPGIPDVCPKLTCWFADSKNCLGLFPPLTRCFSHQ